MHRLPAIKLSVDYWRITKTDPEGNAFGILELACEGGQNNNCQTIRCSFCSCLMSCKSSLGKYRRKYENSLGTESDQMNESFCILSEYFLLFSIPSLDQNLEMKFFFFYFMEWRMIRIFYHSENLVGWENESKIYFYNKNQMDAGHWLRNKWWREQRGIYWIHWEHRIFLLWINYA